MLVRAVELRINDIAFGGKGVGRLQGKAVFVPFVIDGETVSARIIGEQKRLAEAELHEVISRSAERVQPPCPYFGTCGGCVYQHISYEHQLIVKTRQLREILRRIGGMADPPLKPIIPSPSQYSYRNRITVHASNGVVGFFRRESNQLLDVAQCPISMPDVNAQLAALRGSRPRDGHYSLRAHTGARVFTQANDQVAMALLQLVHNLIRPDQKLLIDAFCGAGFFAKALLDKFERVIGIDWDRHAIAAARDNAMAKEQYFAANVETELARMAAELSVSAAPTPKRLRRNGPVLIVDPPAAGLTTRTRDAILQIAPAQLIYVSCNPATLARDLSHLHKLFHTKSITPLDMFPQTAEIEVVAELSASQSVDAPV